MFAVLASVFCARKFDSGGNFLIFSVLVVGVIISFWQILYVPHTLYRPNGDFESYAPVFSFLLRDFSWVVPNYLSFESPGQNIIIRFAWLLLFGGIYSCLFGVKKRAALFAVASFGMFLIGRIWLGDGERNYLVEPVKMSSGVTSFVDESGRRLAHGAGVSADVLYGPYLYMPAGRYCAYLDVDIDAGFEMMKWYVADAFSGKVHVMKEVFGVGDSALLNEPLCFYNDTPHYPKEFKLYFEKFRGELVLNGLRFERTR